MAVSYTRRAQHEGQKPGVLQLKASQVAEVALDSIEVSEAAATLSTPHRQAKGATMDPDADLQKVSTTGKRATYADLEALPDNLVGEIVDGELFASPRPPAEAAVAKSVLGGLLLPAFQFGRGGPGGWWIVHEPGLRLAEDVLVPDLAGWRTTRLDRPSGLAFTVVPDWICEALSPSTATLDRVRKMRIYRREGVGHAWLVDPLRRTLEVFARDGHDWRPFGVWSGRDRVRAAPFEALELELELLWAASPD